jgi:hypothetical protein
LKFPKALTEQLPELPLLRAKSERWFSGHFILQRLSQSDPRAGQAIVHPGNFQAVLSKY